MHILYFRNISALEDGHFGSSIAIIKALHQLSYNVNTLNMRLRILVMKTPSFAKSGSMEETWMSTKDTLVSWMTDELLLTWFNDQEMGTLLLHFGTVILNFSEWILSHLD